MAGEKEDRIMRHILVVEDDPDIRQELKILLENALYRVSFIENFVPAGRTYCWDEGLLQ